MKLLIYGKGWISELIQDYLNRTKVEYILGNSRVNNKEDVEKELQFYNPTNVLCLIGRTHGKIGEKEYSTIDYLEQPNKLNENLRDNLFSPVLLALLCMKRNIHLTYLGTGCIFTYEEDKKVFTEEDSPNFFGSQYSLVKGYTDMLMRNLPVCNLRIRMPISSQKHPRNFITKIVNYEKICSVENSMTVLDDLIPIIIDLCETRFEGTINLTNPGVISHNEILEMYKELVDPSFTWENFTYEEQIKILAAGRSNNQLETNNLECMYQVPHIKESIRNILLKMAK